MHLYQYSLVIFENSIHYKYVHRLPLQDSGESWHPTEKGTKGDKGDKDDKGPEKRDLGPA